jgi:phage head maturation protease
MEQRNNNNGKELRTFTGSVEIRKNTDGTESRTIEGYGVVFDSWSHDLGLLQREGKSYRI